MSALDKEMTFEDILAEFDGSQYSVDLDKFLTSQDIAFEVIDGLICVKSNHQYMIMRKIS